MGAESYFSHILPRSADPRIVWPVDKWGVRSNISAEIFSSELKQLPGLSYYNELLIFKNVLSVSIENIDGKLSKISLEGCLCWFPEGILEIWKLYELVESLIPASVFYPPSNFFSSDDFILFETFLKVQYEPKLREFRELFGPLHEPLLPSAFFDLRRRIPRKASNWIDRIFGKK